MMTPRTSLSIAGATVTEGDAGTSDAVFTVSLSAVSGQQVTVKFATADGTANSASDYSAQTGTLTFSPGGTTRTITVPIIGDLVTESTETFVVNLSGATAATIATPQATGTINDNDNPNSPITVSFQNGVFPAAPMRERRTPNCSAVPPRVTTERPAA